MEQDAKTDSACRRSNAWGLAVLGLAVAIAMVLSARILSRAAAEIRSPDEDIEIKGFAAKDIHSDWSQWTCTFTVHADTLSSATRVLEADRVKVLVFLKEKGVKDQELEPRPVTISPMFDMRTGTGKILGYNLSQSMTVTTTDMDLAARLGRESSDLVAEEVQLSVEPPEYQYTKWEELKKTMLGEATADARSRAEIMVKQAGARLGSLRYAHQGVFQIVPLRSTQVSDAGMNDTSSKEKTIKATVTLRFAIEAP